MAWIDETNCVLDPDIEVEYLVPKFHLPGHVIACRTPFSFNYRHGVGRTDGEGVERGWAESNPLSSSTKEMGPGTRRDTIDCHFSDFNWRKILNMGESFRIQQQPHLTYRYSTYSLATAQGCWPSDA